MNLSLKYNYFVIASIVFLVSFLGRFFTHSGYIWYKTLNLPSLTPPDYVFSIAWSLIFFCTAISFGIVYNTFKHDLKSYIIMVLFLLNVLFNVLWSFLFFHQHAILAALIDACAIEATVLALMVLIFPRSRAASLLLVPYAIWVGFAIILNFAILQLN